MLLSPKNSTTVHNDCTRNNRGGKMAFAVRHIGPCEAVNRGFRSPRPTIQRGASVV
ncbi:hypothetical protein BN2497_13173 [Janthinobacterium sp. CG23_2]|nr:hypothetical protein BN2497_13173 [Janthinobacterium sp. CG23_2]CUU32984.1 hypothetical protein BN3177_13173 [Janthinobacterium sp. CG23_2]